MILDVKDNITLAEGVTYDVEGRAVVDGLLGARYPANSTALEFVRLCQAETGTSLLASSQRIALLTGAKPELVRSDLEQLVQSLDDQALLRFRRPWRSRFNPLLLGSDALRTFAIGSDVHLARRYRMTGLGVARAVARVALPVVTVLVAGVSLALLLMVTTANVNPMRAGQVVLGFSLLLSTVLLVSWAHEMGHIMVLRAGGGVLGLVVVRGWRIGVVHPGGHVAHRRLLAAAGPVAGLAMGLLLGVPYLLGWPFLQTLVFAPIIGAANLLTLLPWASDGRMIWSTSSEGDSVEGA